MYLFVLQWSLGSVGGVNQVVLNLAREMLKRGRFEPIVLISKWDAIEPYWEEVQGIRTINWQIRPLPSRRNVKEWLAYLLWRRRFVPTFERFCRDYKVVAINSHYPGPGIFSLEHIALNFCNASSKVLPLVVSFHGADLARIANEQPAVRDQWRGLLQRARAVVVCSNSLGVRLTDCFGSAVTPCVIHNGLDVDTFRSLAGRFYNQGRPFILSVGKFEHKKGQDVLLDAFAKLAVRYPDIDLVMLGASDEMLPKLMRACEDKGLMSRVRFFPDVPHDQVAQYFAAASVFALPSREEPFGIVLLEAGAFALPVVASRVGGIPEILVNEDTAKLVTVDDPQELARGISWVLDNPAGARAMGARLQAHVSLNFTWTVAYQKYEALLD